MSPATRLLLLLFVGSAVASAACGSTTDTHASAPSSGTYTLNFPSIAAAIATDSVQVKIYDASDAEDQCVTLIALTEAGGEVPTPRFQGESLALCSDAGDPSAALAIPFGRYAVLAVGERGGEDFVVGCQEQTLSAATPSMTVNLTLASVVPATSCTSLAQYCAHSCPDAGP